MHIYIDGVSLALGFGFGVVMTLFSAVLIAGIAAARQRKAKR